MPKLIKLYIRSCSIGFLVAALFVAGLLWFNVANLGYLVSHADKGWLAVLILWLANGIVFAGVQFGIAVMGLADKDDDDDHRGGPGVHALAEDQVAIPVEAERRRSPLARKV